MSGLAETAVDAARERHPRVELILKALDAPEEVCAPEFAFARFEAKRLERNRDLDVEAGLVNDALRLHQQVHAEIFAASLGDDAVPLNPQRVEKDLESLAPVVERVEHEPDVIVLKDVVALGHCRAHFVRLVNRFESDVEKLRIVAD